MLLVVLPNPFSQPQSVPLEERRMLVWLVPCLAVSMILIVVRLIDRDQVERSRIELALAEAIASQSLELYFQPQCDPDGRPHGVESLLRWRHPDFGFVSPASFVPLATVHDGHTHWDQCDRIARAAHRSVKPTDVQPAAASSKRARRRCSTPRPRRLPMRASLRPR